MERLDKRALKQNHDRLESLKVMKINVVSSLKIK